MPALNPTDRAQFAQGWAVTRMVALALCFGAPLAYAVVLVTAVLKGNLAHLLTGPIPWSHPAVLGALFLSLGSLGGAVLVAPLFQGRLRRNPELVLALALSRQATVVTCALLESVAIFGLVAGVLAGPGAAPLALALFLVPPAGYVLLVPGAQTWLDLLEAGGR